jgi:hypothetical protein
MEQKSQSIQFILEEYRDLYQNVMHLENKLFNHLSFYTTLFLGTVTASIAILQLTPNNTPMSFMDAVGMLCLLSLLLYIVGRFEIHMTTELRIRKMKFIEGITSIRAYFVGLDESINEYIVLPKGLKKAPPFLRVGSQDWYQLIYLCVLNSVSFMIFWFTVPYFINLCRFIITNQKYYPLTGFILLWLVVGVVLSGINYWEFSYTRVMDECLSYDHDREKRMNNPIEYDLLDRKLPYNKFKWSVSDWVRFIDSRRGKSHE